MLNKICEIKKELVKLEIY